MKKNNKQQEGVSYRQGDVLIRPVTSIPKGLTQTKRVTLAYGEVTGHHHTINTGAVGFAGKPDDLVMFFEVTNPDGGALTHQEHETIVIPPGKYESVRQTEYTPQELRNVAD